MSKHNRKGKLKEDDLELMGEMDLDSKDIDEAKKSMESVKKSLTNIQERKLIKDSIINGEDRKVQKMKEPRTFNERLQREAVRHIEEDLEGNKSLDKPSKRVEEAARFKTRRSPLDRRPQSEDYMADDVDDLREEDPGAEEHLPGLKEKRIELGDVTIDESKGESVKGVVEKAMRQQKLDEEAKKINKKVNAPKEERDKEYEENQKKKRDFDREAREYFIKRNVPKP